MSRKQNTPNKKPDASRRRRFQYTLSESELTSLEACEKLKNDLESDGAKNLKVYVGTWGPVDKLGRRIVREEGSKLLCSHAAPRGLLTWLKAKSARTWTAPLVIEAELPPRVKSPEQAPPDYQKVMARVRAVPNDVAGQLVAGLLGFPGAWHVLKKLAEIEKCQPYTDKPVELEKQRKELLEILRNSYPDAAQRVGALRPPSDEGLSEIEANGKRCYEITEEIKRIKRLVVDGGRNMAEIRKEQPNFEVWSVVDSLPVEDRDAFNHPLQWGPVVGYARGLLGKVHAKSPATIKDWVKTYRRRQKKHGNPGNSQGAGR